MDVEQLIESSFERLFPEAAVSADWADVLQRAGVRPHRTQRLALAAAAALVAALTVSPLGAAIGHSLGDFSGWLRGEPGRPASPAAQQAFEQSEAKSWAAFPQGTKLRTLITSSEDGVDYTLYGFRSSSALCLRLVATGAADGSTLSCAPLEELQARAAPVLVLEVDYTIGTLPGRHAQIGPDSFTLPRASVSFGIVADGVAGLRLRSDDGSRDALLASNSFLSVVSRPPAGDRVRGIDATLGDGRTVAIPFAQAPFDTSVGSASHGTLHGPTGRDRVITSGTIGWLTRHEARGGSWPTGVGNGRFLNGDARFEFGRVVQPDPQSPLAVGLSLWQVTKADPTRFLTPGTYLCDSLLIGVLRGGGCSPLDKAFTRSPVNFGLTTMGGGDQYAILSGIASDDVTSLRVFLGTGEIFNVPLRDNAFATQVSRAKYPLRIVGYDDHGQVIANDVLRSENGPSGPAYIPKKGAPWTKQATVIGASGGQIELWTAPSEADGVCVKMRYPGGGGMDGCTPPHWKGALHANSIPAGYAPNAPDPVLLVQTTPTVTRVVITYKSGATETLTPADGFVFHAIPQERVTADDLVMSLTAYDAAGAPIGTISAPHWGYKR